MISNMNKRITVEPTEYGFAYETAPPSPTFKTVIPKLMPALNGKGPDSVNGGGIFANDGACKPSYAKKVTKLDWFPVRIEKQMGSPIPKGKQMVVNFINGDITDPYV